MQVYIVEENPLPDRPEKKKTSEVGFQHSIYVPEEQLFQRIPLCRYLSDLSSLFENENDRDDSADIGNKELE